MAAKVPTGLEPSCLLVGPHWWAPQTLRQVNLVGVRLSIHHTETFLGFLSFSFFSLSYAGFLPTYLNNQHSLPVVLYTDGPTAAAAALSLLLLLRLPKIFKPFPLPFAGLTGIFFPLRLSVDGLRVANFQMDFQRQRRVVVAASVLCLFHHPVKIDSWLLRQLFKCTLYAGCACVCLTHCNGRAEWADVYFCLILMDRQLSLQVARQHGQDFGLLFFLTPSTGAARRREFTLNIYEFTRDSIPLNAVPIADRSDWPRSNTPDSEFSSKSNFPFPSREIVVTLPTFVDSIELHLELIRKRTNHGRPDSHRSLSVITTLTNNSGELLFGFESRTVFKRTNRVMWWNRVVILISKRLLLLLLLYDVEDGAFVAVAFLPDSFYNLPSVKMNRRVAASFNVVVDVGSTLQKVWDIYAVFAGSSLILPFLLRLDSP